MRQPPKEVERLSKGTQHPLMKGRKDMKIVLNVESRKEKIKKMVFEMYDDGEIGKKEFLNLKAYLDGKECQAPKELKEAVDKYISGVINEESLKIVLKALCGEVS